MIPRGIEDYLNSSRVGNFLHVVALLGETGKAGTSALLHFDVVGMLSHMFKDGSDGRIFQIKCGQRSLDARASVGKQMHVRKIGNMRHMWSSMGKPADRLGASGQDW